MVKDLDIYQEGIKEVLAEEKTKKKKELEFNEANISINKRGSDENPSFVYTVRIPTKVAENCKIKKGDKIGFAADLTNPEDPKIVTKIIKEENATN